MTYVILLVHLHYYISASPSKLFALHLHASSHPHASVFPCYYCTCTQLYTVKGACMSEQINEIDSCFAFTSQYFVQQRAHTCERYIAAGYCGKSAV